MGTITYKIFMTITAALSCLVLITGCDNKERKPKSEQQPKLQDSENKINSCRITYWDEGGEVWIIVEPSQQSNDSISYTCAMSCPDYYTRKELTSDLGDFIIRSCDSLFVKQTIPIITRDRLEGYHDTADPQISFYIDTDNVSISWSGLYAVDQNEYTYLYSDCFNNLCRVIISNCSDFLYESRNNKIF